MIAGNTNLLGVVWVLFALLGIFRLLGSRTNWVAAIGWLAGLAVFPTHWPGLWMHPALRNSFTGTLSCTVLGVTGVVLVMMLIAEWHESLTSTFSPSAPDGRSPTPTESSPPDAKACWLLLAAGLWAVMAATSDFTGSLVAWEVLLLTQLRQIDLPSSSDPAQSERVVRQIRWNLLSWQIITSLFLWSGWAMLLNEGGPASWAAAGTPSNSWSRAGWVLLVLGWAGRTCAIPGHFVWIDMAALAVAGTNESAASASRAAVARWGGTGNQLLRWLAAVLMARQLVEWTLPRSSSLTPGESTPMIVWSLLGGWTALWGALMLLRQEDWRRWVATLFMTATGGWIWSLSLFYLSPSMAHRSLWGSLSALAALFCLAHLLIAWGTSLARRTGRPLTYFEEWGGLIHDSRGGVYAVALGLIVLSGLGRPLGWLLPSEGLLHAWRVLVADDDRIDLPSLPLIPGTLLILLASLLSLLAVYRWLGTVLRGVAIGAKPVPLSWSQLLVLAIACGLGVWICVQ